MTKSIRKYTTEFNKLVSIETGLDQDHTAASSKTATQ